MEADRIYQYQVKLIRDRETGQVVAKIPALDIADYGADSQAAIQRLRKMAAFHLECLEQEGEPIPEDKHTGEGLYLRVRLQ